MSSLKSIKAVLFDLDGVIIDTESMYMNMMIEYNKKIGIGAGKDYYIKNLLGKTKDEITKYYLKDFNKDFNEEKYWLDLLKIRQDYINNNQLNLKIGVFELINYLKSNNYLLGIVTSNSLDLTNKLLKNAGLDYKLFNLILTREDVSKTKPSPELYEVALKRLNLNKDETIAIEDSKVGINSALAAGLDVINVEDIDVVPADLKSKCIFVCKDLTEIINYLI